MLRVRGSAPLRAFARATLPDLPVLRHLPELDVVDARGVPGARDARTEIGCAQSIAPLPPSPNTAYPPARRTEPVITTRTRTQSIAPPHAVG